jgi:hypothetical protein
MYTNMGRGPGWVAGGPSDGGCSLAGGKLTPDEILFAHGLLVEGLAIECCQLLAHGVWLRESRPTVPHSLRSVHHAAPSTHLPQCTGLDPTTLHPS